LLCSEIQLVKTDEGFEDIKPLPCNRWSCERCGPLRRRDLVELAASGQPNKCLTLTVAPTSGLNPTDRRKKLHDAWKKLVKRILRKHRWSKLPYMAFLERTKAGEPHLHILLRCNFISQRWLAEQMRELIGAPIVWIEQIKNTAQAIHYVTKYVTKEPAQFGTGKRYWVSRKWRIGEPPHKAGEKRDMTGVRVRREHWEDTAFAAVSSGAAIDDIGEGWFRVWHPRGETALARRGFWYDTG
jgi:hypothetical protein